MSRHRPSCPHQQSLQAADADYEGIKNSFPGTSARSAQLSVKQRSSSKSKKQPAQAASDATRSDDDDASSAGGWLKPRTRNGKAQRKSRELVSTPPDRLSAKTGKATLKKRSTSNAKEPLAASSDIVVIRDSSDSSSAEQKHSSCDQVGV